MHVTKLDLKEFRGIKACREPLELAKFNVLIGRNNSGKSAVLQALSLLPHANASQAMNLDYGGSQKVLLLHHLVGGPNSLVYRYAGEASLDFQLVTSKKLTITVDDHGNSTTFGEGRKRLDWAHGVCSYLDVKVEEAHNLTLFVPNDSGFLGQVRKRLSNEWARIERSDIHIEAVNEVVNPTIDERFTEVTRRDSELWVRKEVGGKPFGVKIQDLGNGIEKALSIFLFIELSAPKIVLWDDFEVMAHPSLVKHLLLWLIKKDWGRRKREQ